MFKRLTKRNLTQLAISIVLVTGVAQAAFANIFKSPTAPEGVSVYIISPADGAEVTGPVTVVFGLKGMGVAPAGVIVKRQGIIIYWLIKQHCRK